MKRGGLWQRILGYVLALAALLFVARTLVRNWRDLKGFDWQVDLLALVLSTAALIGVFAWGVFIWRLVVLRFRGQEGPVAYRHLLRIWFLSTLVRYVPGKVWQLVAAAQLGRGPGLSGALLVSSLLVHVGFALVAAAVVAAWTVPLQVPGLAGVSAAYGGVPATLAALLLVHPAVPNFFLRLVPERIRAGGLEWVGAWADGIMILFLSVVSWWFYGVAFLVFMGSVGEAPLSALPELTGINALSFAAGYLVFLAPAGLGIREATLSVLLASWVPAGVAAAIAIAARLWNMAAEIGGALVSILIARARS